MVLFYSAVYMILPGIFLSLICLSVCLSVHLSIYVSLTLVMY